MDDIEKQSSSRFAIYGTKITFSDQISNEKNEFALDEKGRKRFHGAFTGGFSAGYFNSVNTKEGWEPQQYYSTKFSRENKRKSIKPEEYMDEEDFSEFGIAPKRFASMSKYETISNEKNSKTMTEALFEATFVEKYSKIGEQLLELVGFKKESTQPVKIYSCQLPEGLLNKQTAKSVEDKEPNIKIKYKDDTYGLDFEKFYLYHIIVYQTMVLKIDSVIIMVLLVKPLVLEF